MKKFLGLVGLVMLVAATPVMALDGQALYSEKMCAGCHGEGGTSMVPNYPSLRGQNADYITAQVKLIRDGKRKNGGSAMMAATVTGVTDTEIKAIADYLSQQ